MINGIVIGIIAVMAASALLAIVRSKKRGDACIGCPHSKECGRKCRRGNCYESDCCD